MTENRIGTDPFLEPDERQAIDAWRDKWTQDAERVLSEVACAIARAEAERTAVEAAYVVAADACCATVNRLIRHAERAIEQIPMPCGVFLTDAERLGAYRVAVAFLSDTEERQRELEQALVGLLAVRRRQETALSSLLEARISLDTLCGATRESGIEDARLAEWNRTLEAADEAYVALADRSIRLVDCIDRFLRDVLPNFGRRVSKIADFDGRGAGCGPREVRQALLDLVLLLRRMDEP